MGWFGPSKDEVWRQLSQEIGAEYVEGGFWKGKKVQAHVGPWTITLDAYTESSGESSVTYTRLRAKIRLEVKDSEGWFGPRFPEDVDELHFQSVGVIKHVDRLKALFDLFAAVLERLCQVGSARKQVPGVEL